MIKTLSPYYITIPYESPLTGLVCTEYTLKLYVWSGLKTSIPTQASYEITKTNPELLTTSNKINISKLVNPFLGFKAKEVSTNEIINGDNQVWYSVSVFYNTSNITDINTPQLQETHLAVKGYSYGIEGQNALTPSNKVLMQGREFKVASDSQIIIPIEIEESVVPVPSIVIDALIIVSNFDYQIYFTAIGTYTQFYVSITADVGDTTPRLVLLNGTTSPQDLEITEIGGVTVEMFAYDAASGINITSNTVNVAT